MSEFNIKIIDNNTGRLCGEITAVTEVPISSIVQDYITEDVTVLVCGDDLFCLYWNNKYFFKSSMNRHCYLEFFYDVINGLYDNARDAYHIQYGRVIELLQSFDGYTESYLCNENIAPVTHNKLDDLNVSRETLHESEIDWIKRHTPAEEKEQYTKIEKISYFLVILSVIIMATFLLYLFLFSVSLIAEHFSEFTWKVFSVL